MIPRLASGWDITEHLFATGQLVRLTKHPSYRSIVKGFFEVRHQLPERDGELQYRLRSAHEPYDRVLNESELEAA
jgi:hypothetical protein